MDNNNYFKQEAQKGFIINEITNGTGILKDKYNRVNRLGNVASLNEVGKRLLKRICIAYRFDITLVDSKNKLYCFLNSIKENFYITIQDFILRYFAYTKSLCVPAYESIYKFIDEHQNPFEENQEFFSSEVEPNVFCMLFLINDMLTHISRIENGEYSKEEMPVITMFVYTKDRECFVAMNDSSKPSLDKSVGKQNSYFNTFLKYLYDDNSILDNVTKSIKEIISDFKQKLVDDGSLKFFDFFPDRYILRVLCNEEELANNILLDCFIHIYNFNKRSIDPKNKKEFNVESKEYRETENLHKLKKIIYNIIENVPENDDLNKDSLKSYLYKQEKKQEKKYHDKSITNLIKELKRNQSLIPKNERIVKSQYENFQNRLDYFISEILKEEEPYSAYEFSVLFQPIDYFIDFCMFGYTDIHPSENVLYPIFTGTYLKHIIFKNGIHRIIKTMRKYEKENSIVAYKSDNDYEEIFSEKSNEQKNNTVRRPNRRKCGVFRWKKNRNEKTKITDCILEFESLDALMNSDIIKNVTYRVEHSEFYEIITSNDRYFNKTHYCYNNSYGILDYAETYSQLWDMIIAMMGEYVFNVSKELYNLLIVKSGRDIDALCCEKANDISKKLQLLWEQTKEMANTVLNDEDYKIKHKGFRKVKKRPTFKQCQNELFVNYFKRYFEI